MRKKIAAALALLLALLLLVPAAALAEGQTGPVPPERPEDLPVMDVHSWQLILANSYNSIGYEFDLQPYVYFDGQRLDERIIETTSKMLADARSEGVEIWISVALRNSDWLLNNFEWTVNEYGSAAEAAKHFIPPGCNDHQTGLAIDVTSNINYNANYYVFEDEDEWESPAALWMLEHCTEYGYILRYPEGKQAWYGTACTHPHFRYVGVELAKYLTEHDLCLEEYLYLLYRHSLLVPGLTSYSDY